MKPTSRPRLLLASPAWLAIGLLTHVSATALGGWLIAQADALAAGLCLLLVATGAAAQTLVSLRRRIQAVLSNSSDALRRLSQGDNSFRLDAHGLTDFDELLLAIHDLRETNDAIELPLTRGHTRPARPGPKQHPPAADARDWVLNP